MGLIVSVPDHCLSFYFTISKKISVLCGYFCLFSLKNSKKDGSSFYDILYKIVRTNKTK